MQNIAYGKLMCTLLYLNCPYSLPNEVFSYYTNLRNDYNTTRCTAYEAPYGAIVEMISLKYSDSHKSGEALLDILPCYLRVPDEGNGDP